METLLLLLVMIAMFIVYSRVRTLTDRVDVLQDQIIRILGRLPEDQSKPSASKSHAESATTTDPQLRTPESKVEEVEEPWYTWPRNLAEWEMLIGGNLFAKLGGLALIISVSYALNYAFVNDLIGETLRVALGFVGGGIVLGLAHFTHRKSLPILSQVLVAAGVSILYITVYAMGQYYRMVPMSVGMILLIAVALLTVALSLYYHSQPIALMAALGAWLLPMLLATDAATALPLLVYILLVSMALITLVWHRPEWIWLRLSPMIGAIILLVTWYSKTDVAFFSLEALFMYLILALFVSMELFHTYVQPERASWVDRIVALLTGFFALYITISSTIDQSLFMQVTFGSVMALVYATLVIFVYKHRMEEKVIPSVWAAVFAILVLWTFDSLDQDYISIAMVAIMSLVSLEMVRGYKIAPFATASILMMIVNTVMLFGYGSQVGRPDILIFHDRSLAYALVIVTWLFWGLYIRLSEMHFNTQRTIAGIVAVFVGFVWLNIEVDTGLERWMPIVFGENTTTRDNLMELIRSMAWLTYSLILFAIGILRKVAAPRYAAIVLFSVTILKIFVNDLGFLEIPYRIVSFMVLGLILLMVSYIYQSRKGKLGTD
jgi:uncharacterized membrane protein